MLIPLLAVFACSAAFGQARVACVGNSITQGTVAANYPAFLDSLLADNDTVKNYGYSGATAQKRFGISYWNQAVFGQALAFDARIVVIELGTNDCKYARWDTAAFHADYAALVDTFAGRPSIERIFLCKPIPIYNETLFSHIDSILDSGAIPVIEKVAREKGCAIIDLHAAFEDSFRLYADGIHPTAEGYRTMAGVIHEALMNSPAVRPPPAEAGPRDEIRVCPNPFHDVTQISVWRAPGGGVPHIEVYDIRGNRLASLSLPAGRGPLEEYAWNAPGLCAGVYCIACETGGKRLIKRAMLLK